MLPFSFKNRIAFNYIISTALLILAVFVVIFFIVKASVYSHLEEDIKVETAKLLEEIKVENNTFQLIDQHEWKEKEHNTLDVNPIFIQFVDSNGKIIDKSPNLKRSELQFTLPSSDNAFYNEQLDSKISVRQSQVPIFQKDKIVGYILIAVSLEDAVMVLGNLGLILSIMYPLILLILFAIARIIAGRSIQPVASIIATSNDISKDNLKSRIPMPANRDELFVLSQTINNLLDRIQNAVEREKQFTSDASHELRTPLSVIKGTLEVLVRKPRDQQEYEEKIQFCIKEVDRLNLMVDQLLLLARFENQSQNVLYETVYLNALVLDNLSRFNEKIRNKKLNIVTHFDSDFTVVSDHYLLSIVLSNLISNALKYSNDCGAVTITLQENDYSVVLSITDQGVGIPAADLDHIFNSFFRSDVSNHTEIKGTGLGLSIVKRLCDLLKLDIAVESKLQSGTTINLKFPNSQS